LHPTTTISPSEPEQKPSNYRKKLINIDRKTKRHSRPDRESKNVIPNLFRDLISHFHGEDEKVYMNNEALELLKKTGAVFMDSHFVGTSGRHFATYINKDALYPHTIETSRMGELFAEKNNDLDIDVVAAPAIGGIILSTWTAYHLTKQKGKEILGIYTEKTPTNDQILTRGYDKFVKGKHILVIEDLATTGGSVKKVVNTIRAAGGNVVGVCLMVNKDVDLITSDFIGAPLRWLSELKTPTYSVEECPMCKSEVPIDTRVGHGKKFLAAQHK
jgi:orotate phosphoribosyltransferase